MARIGSTTRLARGFSPPPGQSAVAFQQAFDEEDPSLNPVKNDEPVERLPKPARACSSKIWIENDLTAC